MRIIGAVAVYQGKDWSWMRGQKVRIVGVWKNTHAEEEDWLFCTADEALQRLGGLSPSDLVDVQPWIECEARFSFVTSDVRADDLFDFE